MESRKFGNVGNALHEDQVAEKQVAAGDVIFVILHRGDGHEKETGNGCADPDPPDQKSEGPEDGGNQQAAEQRYPEAVPCEGQHLGQVLALPQFRKQVKDDGKSKDQYPFRDFGTEKAAFTKPLDQAAHKQTPLLCVS